MLMTSTQKITRATPKFGAYLGSFGTIGMRRSGLFLISAGLTAPFALIEIAARLR
jgi:hypothetical protein